jgi:hypothetical protein
LRVPLSDIVHKYVARVITYQIFNVLNGSYLGLKQLETGTILVDETALGLLLHFVDEFYRGWHILK